MPPSNDTSPNATSTSNAVYDSGTLTLGMIIAFCGAALLGLSMVVQRHALSFGSDQVPLLPRTTWPRAPKLVVWVFGLVLYGAASTSLLSEA